MGRALALVAVFCSVLAVWGRAAAASHPATQASTSNSRQLLQVDPFAQFNTPTPPGSATAGQPQLVNTNVPAVATSNGLVSADAFNNPPPPPPVVTPVPAPVPAAAALAPLPATAAGSATMTAASGRTPGSDPFAQLAAIQQQLAAYTAALAAARGGVQGANKSATAPANVSAPAAADKTAPAAPAALPPGVVPLTAVNLNDTVQVNITALPALVLPPATTQTFSWVCTGNGTLYLVVGSTELLQCPAGDTLGLSKTFAINGAGDLACPNNRLACPGDTAVSVTCSLATLLSDFAKREAAFVAAFAKAAGVPQAEVVITDVKDLLAAANTAAMPAAMPAAANTAAMSTQPAAAGALPAAGATLPATSGLSSDVTSLGLGSATTASTGTTMGPLAASLIGGRRLKQTAAAVTVPAPTASKAPAPAAKAPAPAAAQATAANAPAPAAGAGTAAVAPSPPAVPTLEVVVNVQPLTKAGAVGAAKKLASPAFSNTLKTGLAAAKITLVKVQPPVTGALGVPFDLSAAGVTGAVAPSALPTAGVLAPPGVAAPGTNASTTLAGNQPMLGLGALGGQQSAASAVSSGGSARWVAAIVCMALALVV